MKKTTDKRILILDDEVDVLEYLRICLDTQGWNAETVTSPKKALTMLEHDVYFLVMTDIAMPEMDGYEFVRALREMGSTVQIALMTGFGYNPKHTLLKINKTMKYPCLFKPFNKTKVIETVREAWQNYLAGTVHGDDDQ